MKRNRIAGEPNTPEGESRVKHSVVIPIALALGACLLNAQAPAGNSLVTESKQAYTAVKANLTRMAEKMPPENYDFKPVPEIRSFGETIAHMADSQMSACSSVRGPRKTGDAASKKSKDDLVAALKASFDECDAAWETVTEANAAEVPQGGRRSRLGSLIYNTTHENEEYGYLAVYMRLKGIVPPSSDRAAMPAGRGAMPGR
jgi:hypothetical protein